MTKYREILRLKSLGLSDRNIAQSLSCSRNTVPRVLKRADEIGISWPLGDEMTDAALEKLLFSREGQNLSEKRKPNCEHIRKELMRNVVTKKLIWTEYL